MVNIVRRYGLYALLLAVMVTAAVGWRLWRRRTPEWQVLHQLDQLVRCASKEENESFATGLWKVNAVEKFFAPECTFDCHTEMFEGKYSPSQISAELGKIRMLYLHVRLDISDPTVTFPSPDEAVVDFTGHVTGVSKHGYAVNAVREMICRLKKLDDEWKIAALTVREVLER